MRRLRTATTDKHATAHEQYYVTAYFSRVILRLRWVVKLFLVVATTENILLAFCRFGYPRISSFRLSLSLSLQSNSLELEGNKICNMCLFSAQIYDLTTNHLEIMTTIVVLLQEEFDVALASVLQFMRCHVFSRKRKKRWNHGSSVSLRGFLRLF